MKTLICTIKTEMENKSLLLLHMIILFMVCYFVLQYFGASYGSVSDRTEIYQYNLSFSTEQPLSVSDIAELEALEGVNYSFIQTGKYIETSGFTCEIVSVITTPTPKLRLEGELVDYSSSKGSVCISNSYAMECNKKIGDNIELDGVTYTISGTFGSMFNPIIMISYEDLIKYYTPKLINLELDGTMFDEATYQSFVTNLEQRYNTSVQYIDFNQSHMDRIQNMKSASLFFFVMGSICLMFVYSYILTRRTKRLSVYSICGAKKGRIAGTLILGNFIVYTISFLSSLGFAKLINDLVISKIFGYNTFLITITDILFFYILMLIVYVLATLIYSIKFLKNTAVQVYRRSE